MSHLTRVQAELMDLDSLEQALKDLGYKVTKNERMQEHGDSEACDLVGTHSTGRKIGFKKSGKKLTVVTGYYGNDNTTLNQIKQKYSYNKIIKEVSRTRKFAMGKHSTRKDGKIVGELTIF